MNHLNECLNKLTLSAVLILGMGQVYAKMPMTLFQMGHASALFSGVTEGNITFRELGSKGNFGLGTFNGIQGEMIALDGKFYQIWQQGETIPVQPEWKTPWTQLVTYSPSRFSQLNEIKNLVELKEMIFAKFSNRNSPYAIEIKGHFNSLMMRSRSPKKSMDTQMTHEGVYRVNNITGTLVGFWFPDYLLNLAVPGFHFHFISNDKKISGHVLDLSANQLEYAFQQIDTIHLVFPQSSSYQNAIINAPTIETYRQAQM